MPASLRAVRSWTTSRASCARSRASRCASSAGAISVNTFASDSAASRIRRAIAKDSTRPSPRAATAVASASARRTVSVSTGSSAARSSAVLQALLRRAQPLLVSTLCLAGGRGSGLARQQDPQQRATSSGRVEHRDHRRLLRSLDGVGHRGRVREGLAEVCRCPVAIRNERHAAAPPQSGSALPARARRALRLPRQRPAPPRRARSRSGAPPGVAGAARLVREPGRSGRGRPRARPLIPRGLQPPQPATARHRPADLQPRGALGRRQRLARASRRPGPLGSRPGRGRRWCRPGAARSTPRRANAGRAPGSCRALQSSMRENRSVRNSCSSTSWRSWEEARRNVWNSPWGSSATCWNWDALMPIRLVTSTPDLGVHVR